MSIVDPISAKSGPWSTFCDTCWKREECKQKRNMRADTESTKGFLAGNEEDGYYYVCIDCLTDDDFQPASISGEYLDSPQHCEGCGAPLIHQLTEEGIRFVKEVLAAPDGGGCCRELWPVVWVDYLG